MKEHVISTLAAGEKIDLENPELSAALADEAFRRELVAEIIEHFELDDVEPDDAMISQIVESQDTIGEFLQGVGFMLAMKDLVGDGLEPTAGPIASDPDPRPAPRTLSDGELKSSLTALSSAFFITSPYGQQVVVEGDLFLLPNCELCTVELDWKQGKDAEGAIEIDTEDDGMRSSSGEHVNEDGRVNPWVKLAREPADGGVQTLEGRCKLQVPQKFQQFSFSSDQVGQSQDGDGGPITLAGCEADCVKLEGVDRDATHLVLARDAEGRRLKRTEMQAMGATMDLRFTGIVARVEVFVATKVGDHEIDITARREPDADGPVTATRYSAPEPALEFGAIDEARLESEFEVVAGRLCSAFEFNRPSIHAHLPRLGNSLFAKVDFDAPEAVDDGGAPVPFELNTHGLDESSHCAQVSMEGEGDAPISFSRVRGAVHVHYPLEVEVVVLSKKEPERNGLRAEFDGHRVTIHMDEARDDGFGLDWINDHIWRDPAPVHGVDSFGRVLRRLSNRTGSDTWIRLSFWGTPDAVRVLKVGAACKATVHYDLEPTPEYAQELAGMQGAHTQCRG